MKVLARAMGLVLVLTLTVAAGAFAQMAPPQGESSTNNMTTNNVNGQDPNSTDPTPPPAQDPATAPEQTQSPDPSGQAAPAQSTAAVNIANHAYDPAQLNVAKGTTVTWTNTDTEPHTVTADNGLFDSGVLQPGQSYSTWLGGSGMVAYHCKIHPDMTGSIVVGEASGSEGGTPTEDTGSNPPNQATSVYP
jgi:plastocyanin